MARQNRFLAPVTLEVGVKNFCKNEVQVWMGLKKVPYFLYYTTVSKTRLSLTWRRPKEQEINTGSLINAGGVAQHPLNYYGDKEKSVHCNTTELQAVEARWPKRRQRKRRTSS